MRISQRQLNKKKAKRTKLRYSTRKLSTGLASCLIGFTFVFASGHASKNIFSASSYADETTNNKPNISNETKIVKLESKNSENEITSINSTVILDNNKLDTKGTGDVISNAKKISVQINNKNHAGIKDEVSTYSYAKPLEQNELDKNSSDSIQKNAFSKINNNMIRISETEGNLGNKTINVSNNNEFTGYHMRYDLEASAIKDLNDLKSNSNTNEENKDFKNEATFYIGIPNVLEKDDDTVKIVLTNGRVSNDNIKLNSGQTSFITPEDGYLRKNSINKPSNERNELDKVTDIDKLKNKLIDIFEKKGDSLSKNEVENYFNNKNNKIYSFSYDLGFERKLEGDNKKPKLGVGVSFNTKLKDYNVPMNTFFSVIDSNDNVYSYIYSELIRMPKNKTELSNYVDNRLKELNEKDSSTLSPEDRASLEAQKKAYESLKNDSNANNINNITEAINSTMSKIDEAKSIAKTVKGDKDKLIETINNSNLSENEKKDLINKVNNAADTKSVSDLNDEFTTKIKTIEEKREEQSQHRHKRKSSGDIKNYSSTDTEHKDDLNKDVNNINSLDNNTASKEKALDSVNSQDKSTDTTKNNLDNNKSILNANKNVVKSDKTYKKMNELKKKKARVVRTGISTYNSAYKIIDKHFNNKLSKVEENKVDLYVSELSSLDKLTGQEKIDRSIYLSKKYFKSSDKVLLVYSDSKITTKTLENIVKEQKIPVIFFDGKNIDNKINNELNRLSAQKLFIVSLNNEINPDLVTGISPKLVKKSIVVNNENKIEEEIKNK